MKNLPHYTSTGDWACFLQKDGEPAAADPQTTEETDNLASALTSESIQTREEALDTIIGTQTNTRERITSVIHPPRTKKKLSSETSEIIQHLLGGGLIREQHTSLGSNIEHLSPKGEIIGTRLLNSNGTLLEATGTLAKDSPTATPLLQEFEEAA